MEKNITLALAREVKAQLAIRPDLTTHLTRDTDILLPLSERVSIGQRQDADLFVSLHADATPSRRARGLSIYTLSEDASDDLAANLAERENKVDVDLAPVVPSFMSRIRSSLLPYSGGLQTLWV
jgi:N-acetylmuramoyl-L-alanine amidase